MRLEHHKKSPIKKLIIFIVVGIFLLAIDQVIKHYCIYIANPKDINDFVTIAHGEIISISLVYNTGVAFSFLKNFGEWLKIIQIGFLLTILILLYVQKELFLQHYLSFAFMLGGGISNVLDRFLHGGVVDYIYWHYKFDFPIFNFADICIDCGIAFFILQTIIYSRSKKQ